MEFDLICEKNLNELSNFSEYIKGPHTLTKRYLKCHKCGESNFCRHQLTK